MQMRREAGGRHGLNDHCCSLHRSQGDGIKMSLVEEQSTYALFTIMACAPSPATSAPAAAVLAAAPAAAAATSAPAAAAVLAAAAAAAAAPPPPPPPAPPAPSPQPPPPPATPCRRPPLTNVDFCRKFRTFLPTFFCLHSSDLIVDHGSRESKTGVGSRAPPMLGCDIRRLSPQTQAYLTNRELLVSLVSVFIPHQRNHRIED